jgi:hypothetical protein
MKKTTRNLLAGSCLLLASSFSNAQVAINNSATNPDASAILDLNTGNAGVNKGFLAPQVALTNVTTAAPVTSPAAGLMVYSTSAPTGGNGAGYYYWTGTAWASLNSTVSGSGINNYVARWTPSGTQLGTGLIQDNGSAVGIDTVPYAPISLLVNSNITGAASIAGYTNKLYSYGILGGDPNYIGVYGEATAVISAGVYGESDSGWGLYGVSDYGTAIFADGVVGMNAEGDSVAIYANADTGIVAYGSYTGVRGYGTGSSSAGIYGNGAGGAYFVGAGYQGVYAQGTFGGWLQGEAGPGAYLFGTTYGSVSEATNGVAVYAYASGGQGVISYSSSAAGDSSVGQTYGVYGYSSAAFPDGAGVFGLDTSAGYAVWGVTKGIVSAAVDGDADIDYSTGVQGKANTQNGVPLVGWNDNFTAQSNEPMIEGYDSYNAAAVYVDYYDGTTQWKVTGSGTAGTIVKDVNDAKVRLACPETPEILFEDYGTGQLVNGKAHIDLDPTIAKNVTINEKHPLKAFIQLEGDCNGVYVANKSASGFDVVELNHGTSNVSFSWHIVANRADETMEHGVVSHNADIRFAKVDVKQEQTMKDNMNKQAVAVSKTTASKPGTPVALPKVAGGAVSASNPAKGKTAKRKPTPLKAKSPLPAQVQTKN